MDTTEQKLERVAAAAGGVIHRRAAHRAGISDRQLRSRVRSGSVRQTGKHTFVLFGTPRTTVGSLQALLDDLSPDTRASGPTAAALHGFDGFDLTAPFDVVIPRDRNMRRIGHRIHTTAELDPIDRATVQGCRATSAARTLIDLARVRGPEVLTIALASGLRDGLFTEASLHRRIVALRRSGRVGIPRLLEVVEGREVASGAHSWLEREFLRIIDAAGLPRPTPQQVLTRAGDRLVRVDFRFQGTPIVIEVLGYRFHRSTSQMSRDAERQNALLRDGFLPFSFTYHQVVNHPDAVVADVDAALAVGRAA